MLKSAVVSALDKMGYAIFRKDALSHEDGLQTRHNSDFMRDPAFMSAYARGMRAAATDYNWRWRVHIGLWAATTAAKLRGDFVECGVNRGFMSSAIMELLDWDTLGKEFWLLDTFSGIDESILSAAELDHVRGRPGGARGTGFYVDGVETVRANFAEWKNVRIVVGSVPATLDQITANEIALLLLDMNAAAPEIAAVDSLWPRLVPGAVVLFDDYAYAGFEPQHDALNAFAVERGLAIASLPTGQGLLLKTAS